MVYLQWFYYCFMSCSGRFGKDFLQNRYKTLKLAAQEGLHHTENLFFRSTQRLLYTVCIHLA